MKRSDQRKFPGKVTSMLHGIACITDAAIEHVSGLAEEDTRITPASLEALRSRIDNLRTAVLGADNAAERREEQIAIRQFTRRAAAELASLKTFVETAFTGDEERRSEILLKLGFRDLYRKAVNFGQPQFMGALLTKVAGNLDAGLEATLILLGLPAKRPDAIRELADHYHNHTTAHEGGLGRQREYTAADILAMNDLYVEVMAIAKKAKCHFIDQTAIRDRFVLRKMSVYSTSRQKLHDTVAQKPVIQAVGQHSGRQPSHLQHPLNLSISPLNDRYPLRFSLCLPDKSV